MNVDAYLDRIGFDGPREPTPATLIALHRAHMLSVPFETLDIALGHSLSLSLPALFDKIVTRRRGGFCYELNGLFAWLLSEFGFDRSMLSARVYNDGTLGPEGDHLFLLVHLDDEWIADVGFGDSFISPFRTRSAGHGEGSRMFRVATIEEKYQMQRKDAAHWLPQYLFSRSPHVLTDFIEMCDHQQHSPHSPFVGRSICSLATTEGRVSLTNDRLVVTRNGRREERKIHDEAEYRRLLRTRFGIELTEGVARLLTL